MILVGDIGGTKIYLGVFDRKESIVFEKRYISKNYSNFEKLLTDFFLEEKVSMYLKEINKVCLGLAGPILINDRNEVFCQIINLPWKILDSHIQKFFNFQNKENIFFLNDLEIIGHGLSILTKNEVINLNNIEPINKVNKSIIAVGTGLGECLVLSKNEEYIPIPSEGGHVDFAPKNKQEIELLTYFLIEKNYSHVSYETFLSGRGLERIYEFLLQNNDENKYATTCINNASDKARQISELALSKKSILCQQALEFFISIYGSEAGNVALKYLSFGGIYLGGGIAPKILYDVYYQKIFLKAFLHKEPKFAEINRKIPVLLINDDKIGLKGAAYYASKN